MDESVDDSASQQGNVTGFLDDKELYRTKEYLVCQSLKGVSSKGIWFNNSIFDFAFPTLLAQLTILSVLTKIVHFMLKPLQQSTASAQVVAGILSSPSILRQAAPIFARLYPPEGKLVLKTMAEVGYMFHLFVLGVQTDARMLRHAGKGALIIGCMSFVFPYACGGICSLILLQREELKQYRLHYLTYLSGLNAMSSFPVITSVLTELKILNSEIGRLASYTALISDFCNFVVSILMATFEVAKFSGFAAIWSVASFFVFLIILLCIFRPFILWLVKRTPERPVSGTNFFVIVLLALVSGFFAEVLGLHAAFGPYLLGVALPDGPPLGELLVQRFETFTKEIMTPIIFTISGLRTNFLRIKIHYAMINGLVLAVGNIAKFVGTLLSAVYCGVPFWDALSLTLVMCCKGIIEVAAYNHIKDRGIIGVTAFNGLIVNMLVITGIAKPLVAHLYDPSKRYMTYARRSIQHYKKDRQLRILVCLYSNENTLSILNIVEASNPTRLNPIAVFVLFLKELTGRASAVLVPHGNLNNTASLTGSDHISNAFKNLEDQHSGDVVVQHFTAVAPFASMHDDICTLALDKRTDLVIVPFHWLWNIDGTTECRIPAMREVNQNVLSRASCSVGILIDRSQIHGNFPSLLSSNTTYRIAMIFIGGPDDPEALAYSIRLAGHPNVNVSIINVLHQKSSTNQFHNIIDNFGTSFECKENITYIEEVASDGVGLTNIIRSMETAADLVVVGRQHENGSLVVSGLGEWSEYPELGVVGDVLATWDFQFSVLVVQQEPLEPIFQRGRSKRRKWRSRTSDQIDL